MKKLFAVAMLSVMLAAWPAAAATYQSSVIYVVNGWKVSWSVAPTRCGVSQLDVSRLSVVAMVDGSPYTPTGLLKDTSSPSETFMIFAGIPNGQLASITTDGALSFVCGGDTYLMPGYVAPPAAVPTLSEWAMILLGTILAGGAALPIHRRRTA